MKKIKITVLLFIALFVLASCSKPNPANQINKHLEVLLTQNNKALIALNKVIEHQGNLQELLDQDIQVEALTKDNSQLQSHLNQRIEGLNLIEPELEPIQKELDKLNEVDLEHLEKGQDELSALKSSLGALKENYNLVINQFKTQFDTEQKLIDVLIQEDPSIQDLETSINEVNTKNNELVGVISTFKETNTTLNNQVDAWKTALKAQENQENESVDEPQLEEELVEVSEPEVQEVQPIETVVEPKYTIDANFMVRHLDETSSDPLVLLTFDDAVQPEPNSYSLEIAEKLKEKGVNAIFFFNGMFLENEHGQSHLKQIHDLGFTIGNHTYSHPHLNQLDYEQTKEEIIKTNDLIEQIIGERPTIFRPSFGIMGEHTQQVLQEEGMIWMNWTYGYDWEADYMQAEPLADIMVNTPYLSDGANLLMHDRKWTAEAIGSIVDGLQEKGYTIADPNLIELSGVNNE